MITPDQVVQGEKLQALASISLVTPGYLDYIKKYKDTSRIRCLILPGDHDNFANIHESDIQLLAKGDCPVLFLFGNMFSSFVRVIAPRLRHRYVLIVHNSDENVDERYRAYLDQDPRLVRCFCQNQILDHPKLEVLPIGIANWQWDHGNADTVARTAQAPCTKTQTCYVYFQQGTNPIKRAAAWAPARYFGASQAYPYSMYMPLLSQHRFCIAPEGNGADTHRFWEALYAGTIPVVLQGPHIAHWQRAGVPMIVVQRWEEVTPELLAAQDLPVLQDLARTLPHLTMAYWQERIRDTVHGMEEPIATS